MTEQPQTPLIGPLRRRGWREIVHFRPLSNIPHVALVVTRQGRLAGVVPTNDRRVLSDYVTWPYDYREVDMRERLLLVCCRVESCDVATGTLTTKTGSDAQLSGMPLPSAPVVIFNALSNLLSMKRIDFADQVQEGMDSRKALHARQCATVNTRRQLQSLRF